MYAWRSYRRCGTDRHNGRFDKTILRQVRSSTYWETLNAARREHLHAVLVCSSCAPPLSRCSLLSRAAAIHRVRACAAARPISRNYRDRGERYLARTQMRAGCEVIPALPRGWICLWDFHGTPRLRFSRAICRERAIILPFLTKIDTRDENDDIVMSRALHIYMYCTSSAR